ncbi:ATP-binding protein [Devosia sp.]|uniref:AAA family ATPase n=1 Tax=Devosia sp. TaxID=1871048 RepID=UPI0025BB3C32|nr:ATP-binding protein [Devosia sp.]
MALLTLMVGLPGSGKTTRARQLAVETGALRLTPDEWQARLFADDMHHPDHDRRHDTVEAIMWDVAAHILSRGGDVILDFGFWSRVERAGFAARAQALGADCIVQFEDVPFAELERRVAARNETAAGGHFVIPVAMLREWAQRFEAPDADEMAGRFSPPASFASDNH